MRELTPSIARIVAHRNRDVDRQGLRVSVLPKPSGDAALALEARRGLPAGPRGWPSPCRIAKGVGDDPARGQRST